jgi:glutamate 5-kinase
MLPTRNIDFSSGLEWSKFSPNKEFPEIRAMARDLVRDSRRVVVKIGTRVLTEEDNRLSYATIATLVEQISVTLPGREFIIVSSGAIALGLSRMGIGIRPRQIDMLQAAAAMGQSRLMHAYEAEFAKSRHETAQILLTYEDIQNRKRYLNIRNTIFALWSKNVVPIVNENDTVSFSEIRFGDNDILAAHLANMIDADLLLILTDIDGVYEEDPRGNADARIVDEVPQITSHIRNMIFSKESAFSSGGMDSKLSATEIATKGGIGTVIANGKNIDLSLLLSGDPVGTYFIPAARKLRGRKKWIAFNPKTEGTIIIDRGGEAAIVSDKKSLLPAGVREVVGDFRIGSNVSIQNEERREIARGLSNFSSGEINLIKGLNTRQIPAVLGTESYFDEIVHRDNMVILV